MGVWTCVCLCVCVCVCVCLGFISVCACVCVCVCLGFIGVCVCSPCEGAWGLDLCVYVCVLVDVCGGVVLGVCDVCFSVVTVSGSVCVCVRACVHTCREREVTELLRAAFPPGFPSVPELARPPRTSGQPTQQGMAVTLLISGTEKVRTVVFPLPTRKLLAIRHGREHAWPP